MKKHTQMRLLPSLYDIEFVVHVEIMFNDKTHHVIDHVYLKNTTGILDIVQANRDKCIRKIVSKLNAVTKKTKFDIF